MAAITINFDCLAGAFTRRATIFATGLWGAGTRWILTLVLVRHYILLKKTRLFLRGLE